ncbi:hypothetical protein M011DRAFT_425303 [Sporormia fimetaria CBS 119925]|uniref:Uncharacterized protein n=1 Tax=Sporormia fimetaria CBS 119925 TaxID=1340428 RepID=A0A6A6VB72_9PLEO|nr:hypothetical protein M011DRAFT_425303 [Sporormia fimetaria CBS 119925]
MYTHRFASLSAAAALLTLALTDPNSVCFSYGVDFVDEGQYFINTLSNDSFTCVSTFEGCNTDVADVLLVDPAGDEFLCSQVSTTPANTPMLSTCPILKNQMTSGEWIIIVVGNNDDGFPFAWQRDISIDAGPQATTTVTPTVTFSVTTTPVVPVTTTSTQSVVLTTGPFSTVTLPSGTALKTLTPKPVTTKITKTFTRPIYTWTHELSVSTKTVTATCTIPRGGKRDKPCTYSPTKIHPAALETPTPAPRKQRYMRRTDRAIDYEYARNRIEAAKLKRDLKADAPRLQERAPDAPTSTLTASTPDSTTVTITAPPVTSTETTLLTTTSTSTLPPATVINGVTTKTITLPTPTRTQLAFAYTTVTSTITIRATFTRTTTVTPRASVTPCRNLGGHIGFGRI